MRSLTLLPILITLFTSACQAPDEPLAPIPAQAPATLRAAHAAYAAGDLGEMAAHLRETLRRPDAGALVVDNALALTEAGYAVGGGAIPADWALPAGILDLQVMHLRKAEPDSVTFQIALRGHAAHADAIRGLRLRRGDVVLLDRAAGLGEWSDEPEDGGRFFELEGPEQPEPLPAGLHQVEIQMADGAAVTGWFILSGHNGLRAPRIDWPTPGAVTHPTPDLRVEDFRSPAAQPSDRRTRSAWVVPAPPPTPWRSAWSTWTDHPDDAPLTVDPPLAEGDYWFGVTFGEARRFGPLTLVRASRAAVPFSVRR